MVIDFHTHMFPHKIAERTIAMLAENSHTIPSTDGTYEGLCESGKRCGRSDEKAGSSMELCRGTRSSSFRTGDQRIL